MLECMHRWLFSSMAQNKIIPVGRVIAPCHGLVGPGPGLKQGRAR